MQSGDVQSALCDISLGPDNYGCWQHPFRETQIRMHPAALRHLSDESLRNLKAKPASEIGGILWGKVLDGSVVIEDAQLIRSDGSFYNATPSDSRNLEQAIKHDHPAGLKPVGYFRSNIRDSLCLSVQDEDLITKHLRDPEHVFLLIRPFEIGICVGAFFFWENGQLQTDGSDLEVPFLALDRHPAIEKEATADRTAKTKFPDASEPYRDQISAPHLQNNAAHFASEHDDVSEQSRPRALPSHVKKRSWFFFIAFACLVVIAAAAGTATYFAFPMLKARLLERTGPVAMNPEVGLKIVRAADGQLDLTWNRNVLARARAQQGLLTITDGTVSKQLTIDSAQLRSGTLTYFPNGSDIQFRLEITLNPGHSIAESVRVILPHARSTEASAISPGRPVMPRSVPESGKPPRASGSFDSSRPLVIASTPFRAPTYIPPREILRSQSTLQQPRAPDVKIDFTAATYGALPSSLSVLPAPPPRLGAQRSTTSSPRNILPAKPPVLKPSSAPIPATQAAVAYVPPRPLRKVMPDVKMAGPGLALQTGKVEVEVSIDEAGHVKDARPVHGARRTNALLANAAIAAARQWVFQPATLHGKAVVAEHRIVFDFQNQ